MARLGAPTTSLPAAAGIKVGIVGARWHEAIVDDLIRGAELALTESGATDIVQLRVAGAFELPVVVADLARTGFDVAVALGVVVRGETPHFDYICQAVSIGLTTIATTFGVPVGFGVLTCETVEQAQARARWPARDQNKGYEATVAALAARLVLSGVGASTPSPLHA
ncbi:6,7-dimethyl-8-ribityllumazine synthase [Kribbella sp. NPDC004536]|uniref:6,7-dimethyl-8-ribityllumazine synthase n=1 Tax=Kribbella sp. NPDC004536 TaxID=3364106 RepID=UPI0036AEC8AB